MWSGAFAGCDAETSPIFANHGHWSLSCCFWIFRERWLRLKDSWRVLWKALKLMIPAIGILIFAWNLKGNGDALQIGTFVDRLLNERFCKPVPSGCFVVVAVFLAFFYRNKLGQHLRVPFRLQSPCFRGQIIWNDDHCGFRSAGRCRLRGSYFTDFG